MPIIQSQNNIKKSRRAWAVRDLVGERREDVMNKVSDYRRRDDLRSRSTTFDSLSFMAFWAAVHSFWWRFLWISFRHSSAIVSNLSKTTVQTLRTGWTKCFPSWIRSRRIWFRSSRKVFPALFPSPFTVLFTIAMMRPSFSGWNCDIATLHLYREMHLCQRQISYFTPSSHDSYHLNWSMKFKILSSRCYYRKCFNLPSFTDKREWFLY